MTIKSTFAANTVHRMRDGLLQVVTFHESSRIDVVFIESGYRTTARSQHLLNGEVKDHFKLNKKELIRQRALHNKVRPRFVVITPEGEEKLFNNTTQIANEFDISRGTVYNILRGDYGTRTNIKIHSL